MCCVPAREAVAPPWVGSDSPRTNGATASSDDTGPGCAPVDFARGFDCASYEFPSEVSSADMPFRMSFMGGESFESVFQEVPRELGAFECGLASVVPVAVVAL